MIEREEYAEPTIPVDTSPGPVRITYLGDRALEVIRLLPGLGHLSLETTSSGAVSEVVSTYAGVQGASVYLRGGFSYLDQPGVQVRMALRAIKNVRALRDHQANGEQRHRIEFLDAGRAVLHRVTVRETGRVADFDDLVAHVRELERPRAIGTMPPPSPLERMGRGSRSDLDLADLRMAWLSVASENDGYALGRDLDISRAFLLRALGGQWAQRVAIESLARVATEAALEEVPLAVTVGNTGCTQTWRDLVRVECPSRGELALIGSRARALVRCDLDRSCWLVHMPGIGTARYSLELLDGSGEPVLRISSSALDEDDPARGRWMQIIRKVPTIEALEPEDGACRW